MCKTFPSVPISDESNNPQVLTMKSLLSGCLRKHIITPSRLPSLSRPVILLAWGCYLELEFNDLERVRGFISTHALGGPEGNYTKDGLYTHLQVAKAGIHIGEDQKVCQQKTTLRIMHFNLKQ